MITLPNLVQDFNIRHLTGSVLVGTTPDPGTGGGGETPVNPDPGTGGGGGGADPNDPNNSED